MSVIYVFIPTLIQYEINMEKSHSDDTSIDVVIIAVNTAENKNYKLTFLQ
jgi:hypothetical protein